jgi:hypothetical protein
MAEARAGMARTACARMENFILMDLSKVVDLLLDSLRVGIERKKRDAFWGTMLLLYSTGQSGYLSIYVSLRVT